MCSKVGGCAVRFGGFRGCAVNRRVCSRGLRACAVNRRVCSKGRVAEILEGVQ